MGHGQPLAALVADPRRQVGEEAEGDVRGLVALGIAPRDVAAERSESGILGQGHRLLAPRAQARPDARQETRGGRLHVSFDPRHLAREEEPRAPSRLESRLQAGRRVHVGVAVDHPVAHELGLLEAGNHAQDSLLLAPLELGLEADDREVAGRQVVLAELHDRVGAAARARIHESHRLHGAEAQGIQAAAGDDLDGQAALEEALVLELVDARALRRRERLVESPVLRLGHRAVDVVVAAPAIARGPEPLAEVDRVRLHHRAHRIEEVEVGLPDEGGHVLGERVRGERPGGHDRDRIIGDAEDLLPVDAEARKRLHHLGHAAREQAAVHRQGAARRHLHLVGDADDEGVHPPHLFLQQAGGLVESVAAEAVGADELGEVVGLVDGGPPDRPHLEEVDAQAAAGELPCRFTTGEAAPDDRYLRRHCLRVLGGASFTHRRVSWSHQYSPAGRPALSDPAEPAGVSLGHAPARRMRRFGRPIFGRHP